MFINSLLRQNYINNSFFTSKPRIEVYSQKELLGTYSSSQALRSVCLSNVSFGANREIYAVDTNGKTVKYKNQIAASRELGIGANQITHCINTPDSRITHGLYFVRASEVESKNKDGEMSFDEVKFKKLLQENSKPITRLEEAFIKDEQTVNTLSEMIQTSGNHSKSMKTLSSIYAIDKNGNYQKFSSVAEAMSELGLKISKTVVNSNLKGFCKTAGGYLFVPDFKLEKENEDGTVSVDVQKIQDLVDEKFYSRGVYSIDSVGNCRKFRSQSAAIRELNLFLNPSAISSSINGEIKTAGGYIWVYPEEIETVDDFGVRSIDRSKVVDVIEDRTGNRSIYAIDKNGNYKKYLRQSDAIEDLGKKYSPTYVSNCLNKKIDRIKGHIFVRPSEIEVKSKDGERTVNQERVNELVRYYFGVKP